MDTNPMGGNNVHPHSRRLHSSFHGHELRSRQPVGISDSGDMSFIARTPTKTHTAKSGPDSRLSIFRVLQMRLAGPQRVTQTFLLVCCDVNGP